MATQSNVDLNESQNRKEATNTVGGNFTVLRRLYVALAAIAVGYALICGLRTVSDTDIGWQLATGRWVAQHHSVASTDVFSYTAYGNPWTYPVGSGLILYGAYLLGGYKLLSWIGAVACAATIALLLRRGSLISAVLAVVAVPLIAYRCIPRADMFTVVLFAASISILWENFRTNSARLWLLPILMACWVNLHLGFIAGLALLAAFGGMELLEMPFAGIRRQNALARLRRELPWFATTAAATVLNPWGWNIYAAILRQSHAMGEHARWVPEWFGLPVNWAVIVNSLSLSNTNGAVYWIMAVAALSIVVALLQRKLGAVLLLAGAAYQTMHHVRMEALTACVVVVVGGAVLHDACATFAERIRERRVLTAVAVTVFLAIAVFACVQSAYRIAGRPYAMRNDFATFGAGIGWWYPERAAEFLQREKPPGKTFNTLDEGGFLLFTIDDYRTYIDGRAIPFGTESFQRQQDLLQDSLDSPLWQREADKYGIDAFILPLNRIHLTPLMHLKDFCSSKNWRPVYLDEVAAVFVRRTPETEALIKKSEVDCSTATLPVEPVASARGFSFDRWANAAAVLDALGRPYEALSASDRALQIFPDSGYVHWLRGNLFANMGRMQDARDEFLKAVQFDPSENTWFSVGMLHYREGDEAQAKHTFQEAIDLSLQSYSAALRLAYFYLKHAEPQPALAALNEALRRAPSVALDEQGGDSLRFQVARAQTEAWRMSGDLPQATTAAEQAVHVAPNVAPAWRALAELYGMQGRIVDERHAAQRAAELDSTKMPTQPQS